MIDFQKKLIDIAQSRHLSFHQKSRQFALTADGQLDNLNHSDDMVQAISNGVICDLFEGQAPFKPRYVMPDYQKFMTHGSEYLELSPPTDLDEAISYLHILYHHVPSVTDMPVFLGHMDQLLLPFCENLSEDQIYKKIKLFWIQLDRTFPDAFVHTNIGPADNIVTRTILRVDRELAQVVPNLSFLYDPCITPDDLLDQVSENICQTCKPHVVNHPEYQKVFPDTGYGVASCYNALPLGGGANTLVRLNLKAVASQSANLTEFFDQQLPHFSKLMFELIATRTAFLHEKSGFFDSFLVREGLISEDRFSPMWGIFGMAEAVELLAEKEQVVGVYGQTEWHHALANRIASWLDQLVRETPVPYGMNQRALLHSQAGISSDIGVTPGTRIGYGNEPDLTSHIQAVVQMHQYFASGISDILTIDETIKQNPQALAQLCKGALSIGMRDFTANIASNDLMRITGYMVKMSDIQQLKQGISRTNTTGLASEAVEQTQVLQRQPREIFLEQ